MSESTPLSPLPVGLKSQEDYLRSALDASIERFRDDSRSHKRLHRRCRVSVFVLSGLSTLVAGIATAVPEAAGGAIPWATVLGLLVVGLSATVTVCTSYEGLRKPAELWIHERTTYYALLDLKREFEFRLRDPDDPPDLEKVFEMLQEILRRSGEKWQRLVQPGGLARSAATQPGADAPVGNGRERRAP